MADAPELRPGALVPGLASEAQGDEGGAREKVALEVPSDGVGAVAFRLESAEGALPTSQCDMDGGHVTRKLALLDEDLAAAAGFSLGRWGPHWSVRGQIAVIDKGLAILLAPPSTIPPPSTIHLALIQAKVEAFAQNRKASPKLESDNYGVQ